jgi:hypothetical protein
MRDPVYRLIPILLVMLAACGKTAAVPEQERRAPSFDIHLTDWREDGMESTLFTEADFKATADNVFRLRLVRISRKRPLDFVINGSFKDEDGRGSVVLKARMRVGGLGEPLETGVAALSMTPDTASARTFVEKALFDLADACVGLLGLVDADREHLMRALDSAEPDEQVLALKLLGRQKAREAVERIGGLLGDPRYEVVETAAEALGEIGDEKAIPFLVRGVKRGDLRSEVRVIEALGRIGGTEAEAYLEMTAVGHEVLEVRNLSESLLKQVRERLRKGGKNR